ncbi:hypothetical protein EON64_04090, partial [archaeon]
MRFFETAPDTCLAVCWLSAVAHAVDKAFSARPSVAAKGKALVLKVMEVGELGGCASLLLGKLADKRPKVPVSCLDLLCEGLQLFGLAAFPIKDMLKEAPPLLNSSNGQARDAAMRLLLELQRWVGEAPLAPILEAMRSAQRADFEKAVAERTGQPRPEPSLRTRKDRELRAQGVLPCTGEGKAEDARAFMEEVDLAKRLKASDYADLIASEKWADQLAALQLVLKTLGCAPSAGGGGLPPLKYNSAVHEVVVVCHGFLKSGGHMQVQAVALRVLGCLAESLRA